MKANNAMTAMRALAMTAPLVAMFLINPLGAKTENAQENQQVQESANDKISLDLKNVDIVELLRIVSLKTGKTIVPSKEVTGRITVYLSNVAFNDVLDIILLTQKLALNCKDNIYYVMSEAEYRKIFGRDYVDQRKIQTVKLTYAKPAAIFAVLDQLKSDLGKIVVDEASGTMILIDVPEKLKLLNKTVKDLDRPLTTTIYNLNYIKAADAKAQLSAAVTPGTGEVIIDERNGKAIISDLPQKMQKMNMLVRELDEESRQVYVEADIVELNLSDKFQRGIDWEKIYTAPEVRGLAFVGDCSATPTTADQKILVGTLPADGYKRILEILNTYGQASIISQPRITVVNNEEATVMVGVREAYITHAQSQATSTTVTSEVVKFIDVGLKLKIVPKISADGFITMKIKPEVSSVKETIKTKLGSRIPIVQISQSETMVKIKDGTMIMLVGMMRINLNTKKRTEVIIFLTPHLTSGGAGSRKEEEPKMMKEELIKKQAIEMADEEAIERAADRAAKKSAE